jgi:hypothetical protein
MRGALGSWQRCSAAVLSPREEAARAPESAAPGDVEGRRPPAAEPCIALDTSIHPVASALMTTPSLCPITTALTLVFKTAQESLSGPLVHVACAVRTPVGVSERTLPPGAQVPSIDSSPGSRSLGSVAPVMTVRLSVVVSGRS